MAVNNPTTNYGWILPTENASTDTWGTTLNEAIGDLAGAISSIDEVIAGLQAELDAEELRIVDAEDRTDRLETDAPRAAYARVYLGTDESVAKNTAEDLNWTEDFDYAGMFSSAAPSKLTIPAEYDGLFTIRGVVRVPAATGSDDDASLWYARIVKNNTTTVAEARLPYYNANYGNSATEHASLVVEGLVNASANDYFELEIFYNYFGPGQATRSVVSGLANTYFEIYRHRSPTVSTPPGTTDMIYTSSSASTTTHSVNLPLANRTAGQMLLVVFNVRANVTLSSSPAGYTEIGNSGATSAVTDTFVLYRRITGAEGGGGSITFVTSLARKAAAAVYLVNSPHPSSAPEVAFSDEDAGDFGDALGGVSPSWGAEQTLFIDTVGYGGPTATNQCTAVPTGYTATDELAVNPDQATTGLVAADIGVASCYKVASTTSETPGVWAFTPNTSGIQSVVAIRGAELT